MELRLFFSEMYLMLKATTELDAELHFNHNLCEQDEPFKQAARCVNAVLVRPTDS